MMTEAVSVPDIGVMTWTLDREWAALERPPTFTVLPGGSTLPPSITLVVT